MDADKLIGGTISVLLLLIKRYFHNFKRILYLELGSLTLLKISWSLLLEEVENLI